MEQYKLLAGYWRDSLVNEQYAKGKFSSKNFQKKFVINKKQSFYRVNSKQTLTSLFKGVKAESIECVLAPTLYRKLTRHTKDEKDYRPEIIIPILIRVEVTKNGFMYPLDTPIIPRNLLSPLDKDGFTLGEMQKFDRYTTKNRAPIFNYKIDSAWETYYSKEYLSPYEEGLKKQFLEESVIREKECTKHLDAIKKGLSKKKELRAKMRKIIEGYNLNWDRSIERKLEEDNDFKNQSKKYINNWDSFFNYINELQKEILDEDSLCRDYEENKTAYFYERSLDTSSRIRAVYEDIYTHKDQNTHLKLFENYTTIEQQSNGLPIVSEHYFAKRLGHNNDQFPLADAQREALSALLAAKNGDILPVNGPPGTGKTTMLLAVVASLWVKKAIDKSDPPIIIATSTNNQAVTNIIDAFAKDFSKGNGPFAGRWIEDINSFGAFFAAKDKAEKAEKDGYITQFQVNTIETEKFFLQAKKSFLSKAQKAFDDDSLTINKAVKKLHHRLVENEATLVSLKESYYQYQDTAKQLNEVLNIDFVKATDSAIEDKSDQLNIYLSEILDLENKWEHYLADENIIFSILSVLPFVKRKRILKAKLFLKENHFEDYVTIDKLKIESFLDKILEKIEIGRNNIKLLQHFRQKRSQFEAKLRNITTDGLASDISIAEIDRIADTQLRFPLFLYATHYWEGRWLMDMDKLIHNDHLKGIDWSWKNIREDNWKRRMKLTPCAVMTSYMLPAHFTYSRSIEDEIEHNKPLYNFIDLLIIDEAGQVSPQVAGASIALSKKTLIIGDTYQIPPITNISKGIDVGNLMNFGFLTSEQNLNQVDQHYQKLQSKGVTANGGSVMKIAQNRTKYFPHKQLSRGLYLYEHRRCYNSIINFCNELCYKGILKPMRGNPKKEEIKFPPMGYLNIDGKCQEVSGSRRNDLEAKIIAGWIINNLSKFKAYYKEREIKDIVAVVTPFKAQKLTITKYLQEAKDTSMRSDLAKITVGTVHSLQGAEKPIVIFSPVYSKHNNGGFINKDPSMLNVAVSRAKDSFLVFGDMSLFNPNETLPTGILARHIFSQESNALSYKYQFSDLFIRKDLASSPSSGRVLKNYKEHDTFLKNAFIEAKNRIIIISPWIIYSTIEKNGYVDIIENNQSIKLTVFTNERFNTHSQNKRSPVKVKQFKAAVKKLERNGVNIKMREKLHSKIVIIDDLVLCVGSFNWFSAQRGGQYANTEHSLVYQDTKSVKEEITLILKELKYND